MADTQTQDSLRVELGAWIEGTTPKKSDPKSMRKEWVTDPKRISGDRIRLSVIRTHDKRDTHVLTLDVGDRDMRDVSLEILGLAAEKLAALIAADTAAQKALADAKAEVKTSRKAPTPPPATKSANVQTQPRVIKPATNGTLDATAWASLLG